jgi:hypothetical protein
MSSDLSSEAASNLNSEHEHLHSEDKSAPTEARDLKRGQAMTLRTDILLAAEQLGIGESLKREECPACSAPERSFSITRQEHGVLYNCFRASCSFRGFLPTSGVLYQTRAPRAEAKPNPYRGELLPLTDTDEQYFEDRFELSPVPMGVSVTDGGHYAMALYRPDGRQDGLIVRRGGWTGEPQMPVDRNRYCDGPKTVLYRDTLRAATSWYAPVYEKLSCRYDVTALHRGIIVLVEDCISAMKVAQAGVRACALVGAELNDDKVREIAQEHPTEVILALDKDATGNAFKQARKYGLAFRKIRVACLERDIKDEDRRNVLEVLGL